MNFPALELLWSPTGTGSVVHGHSWPLGGLHPLGDVGLTFGFEGNVRLRFPPPHEGREIAKIEKRHGAVRLWHLTGKHHCAVNGRYIEERELTLRHRDLVAFERGPVFRVLEHEVTAARSPTLEALLSASPGDAELLHVYGDFLLDHGDPLGERLARARSSSSVDDGTWLDVFAVLYEAGRLEIEWEHGFAKRAVMRESLAQFPTLEGALRHLCALPVMRFLRELVIDVSSDRLGVADGVEALARVTLPKTCTKLSFGDVPLSQRERVVQELAAAAPRQIDVGYFTAANLEMLKVQSSLAELYRDGDRVAIESRIEIGRSDAMSVLGHNVLLGGSHMIMRDGARYVLVHLDRDDRDAAPAKVNGRAVDRYPLRDGDLIELSDVLTARFTLTR